MFKKLLNLFGRKRFDKTEEIASDPIRKIDSWFQQPEEFKSDGAGTLTLTEGYDKWQEAQDKITPDMSPKEYNEMLIDVYGTYEDRARDWKEKPTLPVYTYTYSLDDSGNVRVNKE